MSNKTTAPSTLAIGFTDHLVRCDKANFFGPDAIKGYDLIVLDEKNFLEMEGYGKLNVNQHERIGGYIKYKVGELHERIRLGSVLVILPAKAFQAKS